MKEFSVIVRLGHNGPKKGIEVERWCQAHDAVDARTKARGWDGVKKVLDVIPLPENNFYVCENRGEHIGLFGHYFQAEKFV